MTVHMKKLSTWENAQYWAKLHYQRGRWEEFSKSASAVVDASARIVASDSFDELLREWSEFKACIARKPLLKISTENMVDRLM
eukprot:1907490-Prorocentrum_lima.AAC.1